MPLLLGQEVMSHIHTAFPQLFSSNSQQPEDTSGLCAVPSETAELRGVREEASTAETKQVLFLH